MSGNGVILFDASGNPIAGYSNTALANPQPALLSAGSDYASAPKAQIPKVDQFGTQYVATANPAGGSALAYTGQPSPAASAQYGTLLMARQDQPAPSVYNACMMDPVGALQVHQKSKVTFTVGAWAVTCGTNRILFAMQNAGSMVLRISRIFIYIPPAGGTNGSLLGSSGGQNYYPVYCELRRAATFTGGTTLTPVPSDSNDTLASGVTCASLATGVTGTPQVIHQADAYATNLTGIPYYERGVDPNSKTFIVRPGECCYIVCTSNGTVNSTQAGGGAVTAQANIMLTFNQAPA